MQQLEDFSGPCARTFTSGNFVDFIQRRKQADCNILQGFGAFFVQSCDRFLFPFTFFALSPSSS